MGISISGLRLVRDMEELRLIPPGKCLIKTVNAYSYVMAKSDEDLARTLQGLDYLIPDGMSIVWACRFLGTASQPARRIAGWDLFTMEMTRLNEAGGGRVMFLGSTPEVLSLIRTRCASDYPALTIETYSPPFKENFTDEDSGAMVDAINACRPDLLWIGMTAPKQEKWAYGHWDELDIDCHCGAIGAVFDFYAGTIRRAPVWMQNAGLEWLYRLVHEPRRMWRRYLIGNSRFIGYLLSEKFSRHQ